jgi:NAD(P)-dependent dehydrogenase (short-subunit alcohol dehydrogenase family)
MNSFIQKKIVITGGNSGIGLETAKGLYGDGHNVVFGSRDEKKNI